MNTVGSLPLDLQLMPRPTKAYLQLLPSDLQLKPSDLQLKPSDLQLKLSPTKACQITRHLSFTDIYDPYSRTLGHVLMILHVMLRGGALLRSNQYSHVTFADNLVHTSAYRWIMRHKYRVITGRSIILVSDGYLI